MAHTTQGGSTKTEGATIDGEQGLVHIAVVRIGPDAHENRLSSFQAAVDRELTVAREELIRQWHKSRIITTEGPDSVAIAFTHR